MEENNIEHKPMFFEQIPHPYLKPGMLETNEDGECIQYRLKKGDKNYWNRRKTADWSDAPNLWGPFNHEN